MSIFNQHNGEKMISFEGKLYYPSYCTPLGDDAWEYEFYNECVNVRYTMHPGEWHLQFVYK